MTTLNKTFNVNDLSDFRSQVSIKNKMKELVKNTPGLLLQKLQRQKFINSTIAEGPINLVGLQKSLKDNENLDTAIIETHRRGNPVNLPRSYPGTNCHMYKSKLSTIFDLNASSEMNIMEIGNINDTHIDLPRVDKPTVIVDQPPPINIVRFFGNYFPNSFSIFIRRSELFNLNSLKGIINNYYNKFNQSESEGISNEQSKKILGNIFGVSDSFDFTTLTNENIEHYIRSTTQLFVQDFFENSTSETIYLLHMFTDIDSGNPTFSLQKDAVTADQVTMELFGIKKRNCLSLSSVKSLNNSLLFLSRIKSKITRDCHIIYAKTCGDGVAIEFVKILSYIYKQFIGLLSSDVCCDYRNLFENGYSIRQAPSKLAGTGLGLFAKTRQIEIYKNIEINAPSILTNINQILEKFHKKDLFYWGVGIFNKNYTNLFIVTVSGLFTAAQKPAINTINTIIEQIKSYINQTFSTNLDLPENEYLKRIFNISINKFGFDVYYNIYEELEKYNDLLKFLKNSTPDKNNIDMPKLCNDIQNLCSSPVLIHDDTNQIKYLVEDFMNRFINLDLLMSKFNQNVLSSRESVDESIENNFKIIASMENLLETIITDNKQEVKILTLYKLIQVIYPERGTNTLGLRVINKYITNIINKIQEFSVMKENLNSQELYEDSFDCLDYFKQYDRIISVFNEKYLVRPQESESQYLERQKIKQPLNLLKYILRALKAKELLTNNELNYINLKNIYPEVINGLQSYQSTPLPTQQMHSQQFLSQNISQNIFSPGRGSPGRGSPGRGSVDDSPELKSSRKDLPFTIIYTENKNPPPSPKSPQTLTNQANNNQPDDDDIGTILSPLDDNEVNLYDMDENELSTFYTENNLDFNDKEKNLKTLIADGINNNMDPDKLFDYVISEKTANNENINLDEGSITKVKQAIQQRLGSAFGFLKNQIVRINDLISKPLKQTRENIPEIGGKKSRKYKRHKKNTIRKK